jgi:hypothetical protein
MKLLRIVFLTLIFSAALFSTDESAYGELQLKAHAGDAAAQYDLALHYLFAKRISDANIEASPRYADAAAWLNQAAKQNHAKAQYLLGLLYERGRGVKKDAGTAMAWYKKALANGNKAAACPLARLYEASDIHPKDPEVTRPCYMK